MPVEGLVKLKIFVFSVLLKVGYQNVTVHILSFKTMQLGGFSLLQDA